MGNAFPQLTLFMETTCSHELSECQRMLAQMTATLKRGLKTATFVVPYSSWEKASVSPCQRYYGGVAGTAEQTLAIVLEKYVRCLSPLEAAA